jgi:hypothetical protein
VVLEEADAAGMESDEMDRAPGDQETLVQVKYYFLYFVAAFILVRDPRL